MRSRFFAVLFVVGLVLFPFKSAFAAIDPTPYEEASVQSFSGDNYVVAPVSNRWDAALYLIGDFDKKIQFTNAIYNLLTNPDSGGDFYDLASWFNVMGETDTPSDEWSYPAWASAWPLNSAHFTLFNAAGRWGANQVWFVHATQQQINDAKLELRRILEGGSSGEGGEGVTNYMTFTGNNIFYKGSASVGPKNLYTYTTNDGTYYTTALNSVNATVPRLSSKTIFKIPITSTLESHLASYPESLNSYVMVAHRRNEKNQFDIFIYCGPKDKANITQSVVDTNVATSINNQVITDVHFGSGFILLAYRMDFSFDGTTFTAKNFTGDYDLNTYGGGFGVTYPEPNYFTYSNDIDAWPDPVPPSPPSRDPPVVPDPPVNPDPPTDPEPPSPPIIEPDPPTTPTPDPPYPGVDPDYSDVISWLKAIHARLVDIYNAMAQHCLHIRLAMNSCCAYLVDMAEYLLDLAVYDIQVYFGDKLHYELYAFEYKLELYLHDLADWLASQLQFNFEGGTYDDAQLMQVLLEIKDALGDLDSALSDVNAELVDIYVRLGQILTKIGTGGGGGGSRPTTEPEVEEGFDFWQWLLELISQKLGGIITDFVGDIGGILQELISTFPFSIPWDILAYLTLLDAQRATPVITCTMPAIQGWWPEHEIVIDLSPFDSAMAAVRSMMLILWGFVLVLKTDWLGGLFDFATDAVTGFFGRLTGNGGA